MTDPTPPEALAAALRLAVDELRSIMRAAEIGADWMTEPGEMARMRAGATRYRQAAALIEANLATLAAAPALREVAREARRLRAIGDSASTVGWEQGRVLDAALAKLAAGEAKGG